jgi:hypothetical protein
MSYYRGDAYRGDYYRGDYYRGDPGLFSFIGKAARGLVGLIPGASTALSIASSLPIFKATRPPTGAMRNIVASLPGGSGPGSLVQYDGQPFGPTLPGGGGQQQLPMLPGRHRALHWNRATYVTRGGGTSRWPAQLLVHPKGTEPVPSRRMNVGNAKALRHALHRVSGFAHLARRVMSFVKPGAGRGRFKFKRKRRA